MPKGTHTGSTGIRERERKARVPHKPGLKRQSTAKSLNAIYTRGVVVQRGKTAKVGNLTERRWMTRMKKWVEI
jgi:hypothetical protein